MSVPLLVEGDRRAPFELRLWMPWAVFLSALALRLVRMAYAVNWIEDQELLVPMARFYTDGGLLGENWWTQPAKAPLLTGAMALFGKDVVGWRMLFVIAGAASVLLAFLVARRAFRRPYPAVAVAVLLALDPLSVGFSHTIVEDVLATCFLLAGMWLWLRGWENGRDIDWILAGVILGVGTATRWYVLFPTVVMFLFAVVTRWRGGHSALARVIGELAVVPVASHLVWFLPWMARGYGIRDWFLLEMDSVLVQLGAFGFPPRMDQIAGPQRWFVAWVGAGVPADDGRGFTVLMNNPPLWVLFIPAALLLLWHARKRGRTDWAVIALSFLTLYAFFVATKRPILLYSAVPIVPLGLLALAPASAFVLRRRSWGFLGVAAAWSLYLYPLAVSLPVPIGPYRWLLALLGVSSS